MKFQELFYSRLEGLIERETQEFPISELPTNYRLASVLMLFWPEPDGSVKIVFTERTLSLPFHKGQVSFPGGGVLPNDNSRKFTALRETSEELGIDPDEVSIMGRLDDAWSRYGFHIVPYVGWINHRPHFVPDYKEVAGIIVADVETLIRPEAACIHEFTINDVKRKSKAFKWDNGYVWGVTADILLELFLWIRGEKSNRRDIRLEAIHRNQS